ncbi:hypothetical protein HDU96_002471 [Phlyctochytrium bullatum]|nr:hypothetical protein HDU96_002471 [Phlyctochytrium bullatum]
MTSIHSVPTELLHGIIVRYLSPLDASRLMVTSKALRSVVEHLPFARMHLLNYLQCHCLLDPRSEGYYHYSPLPTVGGKRFIWSRIGWKDGVHEVYWAALFDLFGFDKGMWVVAEAHRFDWSREQSTYYSRVLKHLYRLIPPGWVISNNFKRFLHEYGSPGSYPLPMDHRITSALFRLANACRNPHPTTRIISSLAHIAFFNPEKLLSYLELTTPPLEYLPAVVTVLAYRNRSALIATILAKYALPNGPGHLTQRIAAAVGSLESLFLLMNHFPGDLSAQGSQILRLAALNGHANVVKMLLDHSLDAVSLGYMPSVKPSDLDDMAFAKLSEHKDVVKLLLDHSLTAGPRGIPCINPSISKSFALYYASSVNYVDVVKLLLDHSLAAAPLGIPAVNPSALDSQALAVACKKGYAGVVKLLLDHSLVAAPLGIPYVDPSANESSCLFRASSQGHTDVVKLLLEHALSAAAVVIPNIALAGDVRKGNADVVNLLLDHSFDALPLGIPSVDPNAEGVLSNAILCGRSDIVKLLLDHSLAAKPLGIPYLDSKCHGRPLCWASLNGKADIVKLMLEHPLSASLGSPANNTALCNSISKGLHKASAHAYVRVIKLLLAHFHEDAEFIARESRGLRAGVDGNHAASVAAFLPYTDDASFSEAMHVAVKGNFNHALKALLEWPHIKPEHLGRPLRDGAGLEKAEATEALLGWRGAHGERAEGWSEVVAEITATDRVQSKDEAWNQLVGRLRRATEADGGVAVAADETV